MASGPRSRFQPGAPSSNLDSCLPAMSRFAGKPSVRPPTRPVSPGAMVGSTSRKLTWRGGPQAGLSQNRHGPRRNATSAGLKTTSARLRLERCLELGAQRQDAVLVARAADDLNPNRESSVRGGERKTDRRLPGAVERMGKAQPVEKLVGCGVDVLPDRTDPGRWIGQGGSQQHVDLVPGRDQPSRLLVQLDQRFEVIDGRRPRRDLKHAPIEWVEKLRVGDR